MEPLTSRARADLGLPRATDLPTFRSPTHRLNLLDDGSVELLPIVGGGGELTTGPHLPGDPDQPFLVGADGEDLAWPIHPGERDQVSRTLDDLGSRWRPGMQALHDVATGRATIMSSEMLDQARPFRELADSLIGGMLVEGAAAGAQHVPRAPRTTSNSAALLVRNEHYLPELYRDLENASESITISQFNWEPDGSGRRVIDILKRKATGSPGVPGIDVRVMVDAWGFRERGMKAARELQDELEAAGVKVQRSWPFLPRQGWEHRKLITIDDTIAYMGGLGFGKKYDTWTDLMARVEGAAGAVAGAHGLTTWRDLAGPLDAKAAARLAKIGVVLDANAQARAAGLDAGAAVTLLENRPGIDLAATESFLRDARSATQRLWVTSTYITTPTAVDALIEARSNGADVKLVVSGLEVGNDTKTIHLGRSHYRRLLDAGVEVYERTSGMMHAKSFLADGITTVGSMNLSHSSMTRAREVMARIEDVGFSDDYAAFHTQLRGEARRVTYAQLDTVTNRLVTWLRKAIDLKF
ncbi:MAG: Cardiolipin synthetase [Thermoleophilia bacterium]|nr:Cardiolipin synthetase [Thermoleophilia bacterium]